MIPGIEALACGQLAVPNEVMAHVVQVESSRNPFAIGVVGGRLLRQPRNLGEAVATVRMLEANGYNYSIGLAQVNRVNFERFGLQDPAVGFDVCNNLAAGAKILAECLQRHDGRWGDAFSCYYSGNPRTGYEHGYVQKVFAAMGAASPAAVPETPPASDAIPLAPQGGGAGSVASLTLAATPAERDPWAEVFSARISAPDARRTDAVSRAQAVTPLEAQSFVNASDGVVANPARDAARETTAVESDGLRPVRPLAPEALLVEAMRREVAAVDAKAIEPVDSGSASGVESGEPPFLPTDGLETPAVTQQSSNSHLSDNARVF